ncbi:hypothetical protein [Paenarthrobacter nicotinovorans]|uniref:hypothetical protein n=1 Tax=Paenarthrobacter nicotinovorans TaxID=29320 RepID=UPI003DA5C6A5
MPSAVKELQFTLNDKVVAERGGINFSAPVALDAYPTTKGKRRGCFGSFQGLCASNKSDSRDGLFTAVMHGPAPFALSDVIRERLNGQGNPTGHTAFAFLRLCILLLSEAGTIPSRFFALTSRFFPVGCRFCPFNLHSFMIAVSEAQCHANSGDGSYCGQPVWHGTPILRGKYA